MIDGEEYGSVAFRDGKRYGHIGAPHLGMSRDGVSRYKLRTVA